MSSQWHKWLTQPGNVRVVGIEATALVLEMSKPQQLEELAQQGFGEAVVGAMLVASAHKSSESINLNAQGSGMFKQAIIDASPEGRVRGFLREQKDKSMHTFGADGTNGPWGSGVLTILYTGNFEGKYPYTGMVPINTGFLDDAINEYYKDSEQLMSRVGLFVELDGKYVGTARGALIQALGGASEEELALVGSLSVQALRALAQRAGVTGEFSAEASKLLGGLNLQNVETKPLVSFCTCSQERIERALSLAGAQEIKEALGQEPFLTVVCDFCRKEHRISAERIKSLFSSDPSRLQ